MEPILTKYVRERTATPWTSIKHQGYDKAEKALGMKPNDIIELVKASGLRGRGGADSTGQVPVRGQEDRAALHRVQRRTKTRHVQDHVLMERNPHLLFEGC